MSPFDSPFEAMKTYKGYNIELKGMGKSPFLVNGKYVTQGFVVTKNGCNIMPGATWFLTEEQAIHGIECLEKSEGNAALFWELVR